MIAAGLHIPALNTDLQVERQPDGRTLGGRLDVDIGQGQNRVGSVAAVLRPLDGGVEERPAIGGEQVNEIVAQREAHAAMFGNHIADHGRTLFIAEDDRHLAGAICHSGNLNCTGSGHTKRHALVDEIRRSRGGKASRHWVTAGGNGDILGWHRSITKVGVEGGGGHAHVAIFKWAPDQGGHAFVGQIATNDGGRHRRRDKHDVLTVGRAAVGRVVFQQGHVVTERFKMTLDNGISSGQIGGAAHHEQRFERAFVGEGDFT